MDPIEKEEDRNKALATINTLLEKADKVPAVTVPEYFYKYDRAAEKRFWKADLIK